MKPLANLDDVKRYLAIKDIHKDITVSYQVIEVRDGTSVNLQTELGNMIPYKYGYLFVTNAHLIAPDMFKSKELLSAPGTIKQFLHGFNGSELSPMSHSFHITNSKILYSGNNFAKARILFCRVKINEMMNNGGHIFFKTIFNNLKEEYTFLSSEFPEYVI